MATKEQTEQFARDLHAKTEALASATDALKLAYEAGDDDDFDKAVAQLEKTTADFKSSADQLAASAVTAPDPNQPAPATSAPATPAPKTPAPGTAPHALG